MSISDRLQVRKISSRPYTGGTTEDGWHLFVKEREKVRRRERRRFGFGRVSVTLWAVACLLWVWDDTKRHQGRLIDTEQMHRTNFGKERL